jgi:hypothetical protein
MYHSGRTEENTHKKNYRHDNWGLGRDPKRASPEKNSRALLLTKPVRFSSSLTIVTLIFFKDSSPYKSSGTAQVLSPYQKLARQPSWYCLSPEVIKCQSNLISYGIAFIPHYHD